MQAVAELKSLRQVFPFSALVGQEDMKLALILNAIDPLIGGVLIRGEKGTAKSTAVRSLAVLMPLQKTVKGCGFACNPDDEQSLCPGCRRQLARSKSLAGSLRKAPVVDLPLNATEDMVLGGLDFEQTVKKGRRSFMPGLLARAHRGFFYIDEVNLLDDHLVDVIVDAAANGYNLVEREGMSFFHPARFTLVGTMNPEEGELRPQLLDRFGLCVSVEGEKEPDRRVLLMDLREEFDKDPEGFALRWQAKDRELAAGLEAARLQLCKVILPGAVTSFISNLCIENCVAGHRADLALRRAARALAAYEGRSEVSHEDVARCAPLALLHRKRDAVPPPPPPPPPPQEPDEPPENDRDQKPHEQPEQPDQSDEPEGENSPEDDRESFELPMPQPDPEKNPDTKNGEPQEKVFEIGATFKIKPLVQPQDRKLRRGSGRRSTSRTAQKQGRYVKSALNKDMHDPALDATLRAAAPYQKSRGRTPGMMINIRKQDIRAKVREKRVGNFLLFVVDASGSMGARARMAATKGAIMSLLLDAYQKRDKVALITFRGYEAQTALPPTSSVETAARLLKELPVGGRTPLSAALIKASGELTRQLNKDPDSRPIVLVLTDGKANAGLGGKLKPAGEALAIARRLAGDQRVRWVVVDTESQGIVRLGLASRLAQALDGEIFEIDNLKARDLVDLARDE